MIAERDEAWRHSPRSKTAELSAYFLRKPEPTICSSQINAPVNGMKKPTKRNVSAPIWSKSFDAVSTRLRAVHIRRDAYLESLLGREIELLAQEIKGRNPEGAKQYINRSLRQLTKAEKCSLSLDQDLASRISGAAKKSNQTDHVVKRCQQRGIPPLVLDWLESHGGRPTTITAPSFLTSPLDRGERSKGKTEGSPCVG